MCIICRIPVPQPIFVDPPAHVDHRGTFNFMYIFQAVFLTLLFLAAVNQQVPLLRDEL